MSKLIEELTQEEIRINYYHCLISRCTQELDWTEKMYTYAVNSHQDIQYQLHVHLIFYLSVDPVLAQNDNKYVYKVIELIDDFKANLKYYERNNIHENIDLELPEIFKDYKVDYSNFKFVKDNSTLHPSMSACIYLKNYDMYINVNAGQYLNEDDLYNIKYLIAKKNYIDDELKCLKECNNAFYESI